ncbi:hypothetical protein QFZ77_006477 [Paenibacillus sp. V4I3]|nr:hypothetical protein [Paenibacillus sp. V4I3]MDQ0886308.1 hypothetical protein [Paenibacillus sp. V4I9]
MDGIECADNRGKSRSLLDANVDKVGRYNLKGEVESMCFEMADRSVVASKSELMKAGNSLEGKIRMSIRARKKTQSHNLLTTAF